MDLGACSCDLTKGRCDYNCCCDPDCSSITPVFKTTCNSATYSYIPYCSNYLSFANWQAQAGVSTYRATGGALCVLFANSAVKGKYSTFPGTYTTDATFAPVFAMATHSNALSTYSADQSYLPSTAYRVGDPLVVYYTSSSLRGLVSLPMPSAGGVCTDGGFIRTLLAFTELEFSKSGQWSCARLITATSTCDAGTLLSINYYSTNMQLVDVIVFVNSLESRFQQCFGKLCECWHDSLHGLHHWGLV
jgi:tectonic-1/3